MQDEKQLKVSLDALTVAVNALQAAIAGIPAPVDLTADIAVVDSLKTQLDGLAAGLPGATPPAATGPAGSPAPQAG